MFFIPMFNTNSLVSYPNVYGIDMPSRKELVAHDKNEDEIATAIGADLVIFQTLPDLVNSVRQLNLEISQFDCSVFTGEYVTGGVDEGYLAHIEGLRADNLRSKTGAGSGRAGRESRCVARGKEERRCRLRLRREHADQMGLTRRLACTIHLIPILKYSARILLALWS